MSGCCMLTLFAMSTRRACLKWRELVSVGLGWTGVTKELGLGGLPLLLGLCIQLHHFPVLQDSGGRAPRPLHLPILSHEPVLWETL